MPPPASRCPSGGWRSWTFLRRDINPWFRPAAVTAPSSTVKITCPTFSLSPSLTRMSFTIPATEDGTSTTALSVSSSITGWPSFTVLPGAMAQVIASTALGAAVAWTFGWPIASCVVFGAALSIASTVVMTRAQSAEAARDQRPLHESSGGPRQMVRTTKRARRRSQASHWRRQNACGRYRRRSRVWFKSTPVESK